VSGIHVKSGASGVRFSVHVQPRASRTEFAGIHGTALKVRLHAPPVDGAANDELINLIAKSLGVARHSVRIVAGQSSRGKTVEVDGISAASVEALAHGEGIE
jgi:uncharacterized protein